jgi:hypothetical protein
MATKLPSRLNVKSAGSKMDCFHPAPINASLKASQKSRAASAKP